jgi:hypothetical protein
MRKKTLIIEIINHSLVNFIYGLLGASIVVSIKLGYDLPVLIGYMSYYFYLGLVINRPKYETFLGKHIIFPVPTALGAFTGFKIAPIIINYLT